MCWSPRATPAFKRGSMAVWLRAARCLRPSSGVGALRVACFVAFFFVAFFFAAIVVRACHSEMVLKYGSATATSWA